MIHRTAPETAARARALYGQGVPVKAITAETGLSTRQIYYWLDREDGAARKAGKLADTPTARRRRADRARPPGAVSRRRLMSRLWKAAETQIGAIEARLEAGTQASGETAEGGDLATRDTEREARALAVLARVLRELTALEAAARRAHPDAKAGASDGARDPDTFRRELARRLEHLRDSAEAAQEMNEQDTRGQEATGQEMQGQETPGGETPGRETPGRETPGRETPGRETTRPSAPDGSGRTGIGAVAPGRRAGA